METMKPCSRTFFSFFLGWTVHLFKTESLLLCFGKKRTPHRDPGGMRLRLMGAELGLSGAGRGKVRSQSEKKSATSLYSQSAKGKRTKHSTSSRATGSRYTEKRQSPSPRGRGGGQGWGCLLGLPGAETQRARAQRRPGRPGCRLRHFRSRPPAQRQVLVLPGAPAALCAARSAPASVQQPGGTAAGGAGGGEAGRRGGSRRPCPPAGRGARGAQGRGRGEPAAAPQSRAPGRSGRERRGTGAVDRPGRKRGVPSEGRAPELRAAHTLASDSWQP